jgi:hypothetical protein
MLFFGLSLVSGVIAILVAQTLDIECQNADRRQRAVFQPAPKPAIRPVAIGQFVRQ